MSAITVIPTTYADVQFRSRLEARWAVFFDALGVPWEYEPEAFTDGRRSYLPDFWLPGIGYFEVKPSGDYDADKLELVPKATGERLYVGIGRPGLPLGWSEECCSGTSEDGCHVLTPDAARNAAIVQPISGG